MPELIEILIRSVGLFLLVIILVRLMGKRNASRMIPYRFVTYVAIGVIAALTAANVIPNILSGLIALGVFALLPIALDYLSLRSKMVHDLVHGKEAVLIKQGQIMEENLRQVRLTGEELLSELRNKDAFSVADVEFAVMESTGDINVMKKSHKRTVTSYDLGKKVSPKAEPQTVVLDGNILNDSLTAIGLNQGWLNEQLESAGVSLDNVFLGQVDSSGELYLDLFDDSIQVPQPKVREELYASLEKIQAELMMYSEGTKDQEAKSMYAENADRLKYLLEKIEPYLLR